MKKKNIWQLVNMFTEMSIVDHNAILKLYVAATRVKCITMRYRMIGLLLNRTKGLLVWQMCWIVDMTIMLRMTYPKMGSQLALNDSKVSTKSVCIATDQKG